MFNFYQINKNNEIQTRDDQDSDTMSKNYHLNY